MRALARLSAARLRLHRAGFGARHAAIFPNRPVRIVVPFPAGGPTDVNMRIVGQKLSEIWGQGVVIENRPGANTGIGAQMVAKSPADGYTLLAAMDTTLVMNPATGAAMNYDPFKDFAADHADGEEHLAADGAGERRAEDDPGADRARQGERQEAQLRRRHHHHAARGRDLRQGRRHRGAAHSLQGQLRGGAGPAHRQRRFHRRRHRAEPAADQQRPVPRARQAQQPRAAGLAGGQAAGGGLGPADRRDVELDRPGRAGRHAARRSCRKSTPTWCAPWPTRRSPTGWRRPAFWR